MTIRPVGTAAWWLPLALAAVAAAGFAFDLTLLYRTGTALAVIAALIALRSITERLVISEDGLKARWLVRRRTIRWERVFRLSEVHSALGLRWQLHGLDERTVTLPALRCRRRNNRYDEGGAALEAAARAAGVSVERAVPGARRAFPVKRTLVIAMVCLLAMAALMRPWRWISWSEAVAIPQSCDVLREVYPAVELKAVTLNIDARVPSSTCDRNDASVSARLAFLLAERDGRLSGRAVASDAFIEFQRFASNNADYGAMGSGNVLAGFESETTFDHTSRPGVGDDSIMMSGPCTVILFARTSNVIIIVAVASTDSRETFEAEAVSIARHAVDAVNV